MSMFPAYYLLYFQFFPWLVKFGVNFYNKQPIELTRRAKKIHGVMVRFFFRCYSALFITLHYSNGWQRCYLCQR